MSDFYTNEKGHISALDPDSGEFVFVAPQDLQRAVEYGFQPETNDAWVDRQMRKRYGDKGLEAGALGFLSDLSFGVLPSVVNTGRELIGKQPLNLEAIKRYNEGSYDIGGVAGALGSLAIPGGPMAKLGGAAAKAGATAAAKVGTKVGSGVVGKAVTKATDVAVRGGIEGAGFAVQHELGEMGVEGVDSEAEAFKRIGSAVLSGATTGGALGLAGAAIIGPLKVGAQKLPTGKLAGIGKARMRLKSAEKTLAKVEDAKTETALARASVEKKYAEEIARLEQKMAQSPEKSSGILKKLRATEAARSKELKEITEGIATEAQKKARAALKDEIIAYQTRKAELGSALAGKSTAFNLAAQGAAALAGSAGGILGSYVARDMAKKFLGRAVLKKVVDRLSKIKGLDPQVVRQKQFWLDRGRLKAGGKYVRRNKDGTVWAADKQVIGEFFADALARPAAAAVRVAESVPGHIAIKGAEMAARLSSKAAPIYTMANADLYALAEDVHEIEPADTSAINLATMAGVDPQQAAQAAFAGIQYLQQHSPFKQGQERRRELPRTEKIKWANRVATVVDPGHVLDKIADGSVAVEHVEALKAAHPMVYQVVQELAQDVIDAAEESGVKIDTKQQKLLTMLLSGSSASEYTADLQALYQQPESDDLKARNIRLDNAAKAASAVDRASQNLNR